ncbi:MAG: molybdenum cofactor synthesis domain-containing protein [Paracoccaceae bacterium]
MILKPPKLTNNCFSLPRGVNWMPVSEALSKLKKSLQIIAQVEEIPVDEANGRILSKSPKAIRSSPPVSNSAVDGFGFAHSSLTPGKQTLKLQKGFSAAGIPFNSKVKPGYAIKIFTGAPLPTGVDTVVLKEDTNFNDLEVAFSSSLRIGSNTRRQGEDINKGKKILEVGSTIRPPNLALLKSVGVNTVSVYKKLKVGVLSTGNELVSSFNKNISEFQICDSNKLMLMTLVSNWGFEAIDLGIVQDNKKEVQKRILSASKNVDVILSTGGASESDEDYISKVMNEFGSVTSWRIAVKPGRPIIMGIIHGVPLFGLPGNSVAAFVCAVIFTRPALLFMSGAGWDTPPSFITSSAFSKKKKQGRREFLRARVDKQNNVEVYHSEGSGKINSISWANGLVDLSAETTQVSVGDPIKFIPFSVLGV